MDTGLGNRNEDVEDEAVYALHDWHAVSGDGGLHPAEDQTGILLRPDGNHHHLPPPRLHGSASCDESYRRRFDGPQRNQEKSQKSVWIFHGKNQREQNLHTKHKMGTKWTIRMGKH